MRRRRLLPLLTVAALAACGNGDEARAPSPAEADTAAAAIDTVTQPLAAGNGSAQLPPDFPSDFPLPPNHVVLEGTATGDEAGVYASAVLAVETADAEQPFAWYRQALTDAGWQIAAQGRSDDAHSLHATQGESYVDLTVQPDPERAGWVVIETSIWMVEAL